MLFKRDAVPGRVSRVRPDAHQRRDVPGPLRRVLRAQPRAHDVSRARRVAARLPALAEVRGRAMSAIAEPRVTAPERHDILSWITTTDHKRIGVLYMATTLMFMAVAGVLAIAIRTQLARPGSALISRARLQPDLHAARNRDDLLGHRAVRARSGELSRPAANRRARHGVPAAERDVVLDVSVRRADGVRRRRDATKAPRRRAGRRTRRCPRSRSPPAWARTSGSSAWRWCPSRRS